MRVLHSACIPCQINSELTRIILPSMAGYELPVTRMDQLGVGTTDYLGRSLAGPGDSHTMSRSLAGGPGVSLSSPSSLSSSIHISTGKSSRPVSPPMIQVLTFPPLTDKRQIFSKTSLFSLLSEKISWVFYMTF